MSKSTFVMLMICLCIVGVLEIVHIVLLIAKYHHA